MLTSVESYHVGLLSFAFKQPKRSAKIERYIEFGDRKKIILFIKSPCKSLDKSNERNGVK